MCVLTNPLDEPHVRYSGELLPWGVSTSSFVDGFVLGQPSALVRLIQ